MARSQNFFYRQQKRLSMGNRSKECQTWIGGPQEKVKMQHVPGYQGHVRGYISENIYGGSFSKGTSKCLAG